MEKIHGNMHVFVIFNTKAPKHACFHYIIMVNSLLSKVLIEFLV